MSAVRRTTCVLTAFLTAGLLDAADAVPAAADVALAGGVLSGRVLDDAGLPLATEVRVRSAGGPVRTAAADAQGRFRFEGMTAGVCVVEAGGRGRPLRLWQAGAPRHAAAEVVLVVGDAARGNRLAGNRTKLVLGGAAVAAGVIGGIAWLADDDADGSDESSSGSSDVLDGPLTDPADLSDPKAPVSP